MQFSKRPVAIAYRRVSTDKQGRSGLGLADQDGAIRAFCEMRGLTLEAEFTEIESASRKNVARPELAKALATAKRKGGILVIATLSRLGRRVAFVSALMEQGVPFAAADAPDDEPFILHVKAAWAEEEARKISIRTKSALAQLKADGYLSKTKGRIVKLGNPQNLTSEARVKGAATNRDRATVEHAAKIPTILALRNAGKSLRTIGAEIGVSAMTISRLLERAG